MGRKSTRSRSGGKCSPVHLALNYTPVYTAHCKKEGEMTSLRPPRTVYFIAGPHVEKRWEHREKPLSAMFVNYQPFSTRV